MLLHRQETLLSRLAAPDKVDLGVRYIYAW